MSHPLLLSISVLSLILLILVIFLVFLLARTPVAHMKTMMLLHQEQMKTLRKSHQQEILTMEKLLHSQMQENQSLRNQLRAQSAAELIALQHATLPSDTNAANEQGSNPISVDEALMWEDQLAQEGYTQGDLGGLESAGWASPVIRNDSSGDPVAFDVTGT